MIGLWYISELLILPAIFFALYAQFKVKSTFKKQSKVRAASGISGAQVARGLLDSQGLSGVPVETTPGSLSDHYDPRTRVLRLSPEVYHGNSVAALGVAAHEVGHAIQHKVNYGPINLRNSIFPVANLGSNLAIPLILLGMFLRYQNLILFGIIAFTFAVVFQVVTLPVEFNASGRALALLESNGYVTGQEVRATKSVLDAAALTYVAATLVSLFQLLRFILLFVGQSRDD
ncbi:MAG TPA: zinc metallopeptidase [Bacillota bacterium]|nr:zinc metallopeptidase [Bacillota bacterium]